jgi:hypothetical protein
MSKTQSPIQIPGYTYGTSAVAKSPLSEQDFELLKRFILTESKQTHRAVEKSTRGRSNGRCA